MMEQGSGNFLKALRSLNVFLQRNNIKFCLIGGLAVQVRGKPRFTRDIDLTVLAQLETERELLDLFLASFKPRIEDALNFALLNKVLLIEAAGVPVDMGIGLTGFEAASVARATMEKIGDQIEVPVCTAEDLIIHKVLAARAGDLEDIRHVLVKNQRALDEKYIIDALKEFEGLLEQDLISIFQAQRKAVLDS